MPGFNYNFGNLNNGLNNNIPIIDMPVKVTGSSNVVQPLPLPVNPFGSPDYGAPSATSPSATPQAQQGMSMMQLWSQYKVWIMIILIVLIVSVVLWKTLK